MIKYFLLTNNRQHSQECLTCLINKKLPIKETTNITFVISSIRSSSPTPFWQMPQCRSVVFYKSIQYPITLIALALRRRAQEYLSRMRQVISNCKELTDKVYAHKTINSSNELFTLSKM